MTKYKCGHTREVILLDCNHLSLASWFIWVDSVGWKGDKSQCWDCYCKEKNKNDN